GSKQVGEQWSGDCEIVIERRADVAQNVRAMIYEALVSHFPKPPVASRIRRRNGPLAVRNRICGIGDVLAIAFRVFCFLRPAERKRSITLQVEIGCFGLRWWPGSIRVPGVRAGLEHAGLPREFFACAVEIVAEERRLNVVAELASGFMPAQRDD